MNYFCVFLVLCFATFTICTPVENVVAVEIFTNKSAVFSKYPTAKTFINEKSDATSLVALQHTLGQRVAGDRLVATGSDYYSWSYPQDVTLTLTYPASGVGAVLTYLRISVNQDTFSGQAYLVSGGIGQRNVQIAVLAQNTRYFDYVAEFYGY